MTTFAAAGAVDKALERLRFSHAAEQHDGVAGRTPRQGGVRAIPDDPDGARPFPTSAPGIVVEFGLCASQATLPPSHSAHRSWRPTRLMTRRARVWPHTGSRICFAPKPSRKPHLGCPLHPFCASQSVLFRNENLKQSVQNATALEILAFVKFQAAKNPLCAANIARPLFGDGIEIETTMIIPLISHARDLGGFFVRRYPRRYPDTILRTKDATEVRSKSLELLATPAGFEPATFSLEGCCSIP
jgi:hypothetical protein